MLALRRAVGGTHGSPPQRRRPLGCRALDQRGRQLPLRRVGGASRCREARTMTTQTITLRVDAAEYRELASRAERDKVTLSDYIRVRLGLPGQGPQDDDGGAVTVGDTAIEAQLADHDRRLNALEAHRNPVAAA